MQRPPAGHDSDAVILTLAAAAEAVPAAVAGPSGRSQAAGLAAGWGRAALAGLYPCQGRTVPVRAGPPAACADARAAATAAQPTRDVWCGVAAGRQNTCIGDSGGPVYVPAAPEETVFALTSWGVGDCSPEAPGFYSVLAGTAAAPWGDPPRTAGPAPPAGPVLARPRG